MGRRLDWSVMNRRRLAELHPAVEAERVSARGTDDEREAVVCIELAGSIGANRLSGAAEVYGLLRPHFRDIRGINFPFVQTVIVSAKSPTRGLGVNLARTLYSMRQNIKHVIVVDEDIDPYDFQQVFFAMTIRVDASKDVQILNVMCHVNDPGGEGRTVGGMIIDATRPRDSEEFEITKPQHSGTGEGQTSA